MSWNEMKTANNNPEIFTFKAIGVLFVVFLSMAFEENSVQARETLEQKNEALVSWVEEKITPTREWLEGYVELAEQWVQKQSAKVQPSSKYPAESGAVDSKRNESAKGILGRVNRDEFDKAVAKVKRNYDGVILSVKRLDLETVKYRIKILLHSGKVHTVSVDSEESEKDNQTMERVESAGLEGGSTDVIAINREDDDFIETNGENYR
ncbi:MAG: hypothetical protein COB51_00945 [Moraxellaceae bacterium]|nr:MAG: hypothetical protein COB51_00945 [Moraxellaceae bacterium]